VKRATASRLVRAGTALPVATAVVTRTADSKFAVEQLQQALGEDQQMFRLLLDGIKDYAIYMLDPTGKVISWNTGAARIKGYRSEEILGRDFSCFYRAEDVEAGKPVRELQVSLSQGRFEEQAWRVRKDGSIFWAQVVITPMYDDSGAHRGFSKVARDITGRKQAEDLLAAQAEELSRQAKELARSEREVRKLNDELEQRAVERTAQLEAANQELETFTYSVSHDLRAPLRHIGGFSRILAESFGPGMAPEARQHLQRIEDGVQRMGRLVDELLNLARVVRHTRRLQATNLNSVIAEVVSLLQPEAEGRAITWNIANLPPVACDPILIKQVFQNLLANALKFTRPRDRAVIEISHRQENGQMVLRVRDNGVGFDMKYTGKLFGVFQRLHRAEDFEGTGVGLAIVQRIILKHGGRVWVEAELDKGATFYFTLGAGEQTGAKPEEVNPTEGKPSEAKHKAAAAGANHEHQ
jgi:PAS domain S-box-containing protein